MFINYETQRALPLPGSLDPLSAFKIYFIMLSSLSSFNFDWIYFLLLFKRLKANKHNQLFIYRYRVSLKFVLYLLYKSITIGVIVIFCVCLSIIYPCLPSYQLSLLKEGRGLLIDLWTFNLFIISYDLILTQIQPFCNSQIK